MRMLLDHLIPKTGILHIFLLIQMSTTGQCLKTLPYENYFSGTGALACWNDTTGTLTPIINGSIVRLNGTNTTATGTSILISPPIFVNKTARLTYSWIHFNYGGGFNDSLHVYVKRTTDSIWTVLKNYPTPFQSPFYQPLSSSPRVDEDFELDSTYVNDTILVRFVYHAGTNPHYMYLDNFKVVADKSDTIYSLPFQENFDGNTWRPDSGFGTFTQYYKMDDDWRFVPGQHKDDLGMRWVVTDDSTYSSGTGPLADHTGNGNYVYTESSYGAVNAMMYLPFIDLSGESYPQLSFWYYMRGATMGTLNVEQYINSVWVVLDSIVGPQQNLITDPWKKQTVLLDSAGTTQLRLRMRSNWNNATTFLQDAAIDDMEIAGAACPFPNQFSVNFFNKTTTTADVVWADGPNSNAYILEYSNTGFSPGNGQIDTVYSTFTTLSGLQPNTTYDVYVRLLCGAADTSVLKGPYTFQTECIFVAPYVETFNDTIIDSCWKTHNQLATGAKNAEWKSAGTIGFPWYGAQYAVDHTGNNGSAIGVDGSSPYPLDSIAILSPFIDVSQLTIPKLKLWIFSDNTNFPGQNNAFYVDFFDGTQWNYDVLTYANDSSDWVELSLLLNQFNITGNVRFRLVVDKDSLNAAWYNDIVVDDFSVIEGYGDACDLPDSVQALYVGCDSITIGWNSAANNNLTRIKYGPTGFNFRTSGNWLSGVSSPFTINNLQIGAAYDIYIVDSCANGIGISAPITVETDSTLLPVISYTKSVRSYTDTSVTYFFDARNTIGGNSFIWDFGGGNTITGDTALWTYYINYNHWVTLNVENACGIAQKTFNVLVGNIDIQEAELQPEISLFPNPNSGSFYLSLGQIGNYDWLLSVWNEYGTVVYRSLINPTESDNTVYVSLPNLRPGVYFLELKHPTNNQTYRKKFVIQ